MPSVMQEWELGPRSSWFVEGQLLIPCSLLVCSDTSTFYVGLPSSPVILSLGLYPKEILRQVCNGCSLWCCLCYIIANLEKV